MPTHVDQRLLVLRLRPSRRKARDSALAETLALVRGLGASAARGGPLSELTGIAWVTVPGQTLDAALSRLRTLGYVESVHLVTDRDEAHGAAVEVTRWRGREVALVPLYHEPEQSFRERAPDRRKFLLECADGVVRPITGYRGGSEALEHRALPVVDARLLVNLAAREGERLLDPFAGAGAVIIAARERGISAVSLDFDRALRFGLREFASCHVIGDARALPFADRSFDAVASEPPYHQSALQTVLLSITEAARVVRLGGRIALLAAESQASQIREAAARARLMPELDSRIDRKGTWVQVFCWTR
ncbi:MAG TPA: methyltransferase domain-containing protein [Candidatus Binataceae bacterium]|nr:methyltransferase domain-containing protein [Candidatus Binataceae bacterium]